MGDPPEGPPTPRGITSGAYLQIPIAQWYPPAQSPSAWQLVPQAVADAQAKCPGQGAAVPAPQLPAPSHEPWVSIPPAQEGDAAAHALAVQLARGAVLVAVAVGAAGRGGLDGAVVVAADVNQAVAVGALGAGAAGLAVGLEDAGAGLAVAARAVGAAGAPLAEGAALAINRRRCRRSRRRSRRRSSRRRRRRTQVPLVPKQAPLAQSAPAAQCLASAHGGQAAAAVDVGLGAVLDAVGAGRARAHSPRRADAARAVGRRRCTPCRRRRGGQRPPQSTSVSVPSLVPSTQVASVQWPLPSQVAPPWSLQEVPFAAAAAPQRPVGAQVGAEQEVPVEGQSAAVAQSAQWPLPSQAWPPCSEQAAPAAARVVTQALPVQATEAHAVPVTGQSPAETQATQCPSPSQKLPPLLLQPCSAGRLTVPQQPAAQEGRAQSGAGGQSGVAKQATHPPPVPAVVVVVVVWVVVAPPVAAGLLPGPHPPARRAADPSVAATRARPEPSPRFIRSAPGLRGSRGR